MYHIQLTMITGTAVSETGVERVILTTAQATNLYVGSSVMLGVQDGTDRNVASNYSILDGKLITAIETIHIDDADYAAVYIDNGGVTFRHNRRKHTTLQVHITLDGTTMFGSGWKQI